MNYHLANPVVWMHFLRGKYLVPWHHIASVEQLDIEELKRNHIRGLIFDVDNTLTDHHGMVIHKRFKEKLNRCKNEFGCVILSNCGPRRFAQLQDLFDIPIVPCGVKKPGRNSFETAGRMLELPHDQIAVVGDRILTDILGGNRAGCRTILVDAFDHSEPWAIRFLRKLEKLRTGFNTDSGNRVFRER